MRLKGVARSFIILLAFSLVAFIVPQARSQQKGGAPPSNEGKTVEQVKKNIQVLKGLPASQLTMVMNYFASSLGVKCEHCHVIDTTGWYMEKDDKPAKATARKMIQMVMDVNAKDFEGRHAVTCYTCHRGSTEPTNVIPLPQPAAKPEDENAEDAASLPGAEQLIAGYESALGGADALKKVTSRMSKGVAVDMQGHEMPVEVLQQSSGKYVSSVTMKEGMTRSEGYDGTAGWMSSPRGAHAFSPGESEEFKNKGALFPTIRMRELAKSMSVRKKDMVDGKAAYLLVAETGEGTTERYYIDIASGLLVRKVIVTGTKIGDIPEQVDYTDYRAVDGVKVPFSVQIAAVDPRDNSAQRFTSITQNVPVDEKKFVMPEVKPRKK